MNAQPPVVADATATDDARPHRLFITGANGYVGRNLTHYFLQKGVEVVALVRTPQAAEQMAALGAVPAIGDLFTDTLTEAMAGCDALIHAAADTDHGHGGADQMRVNAQGAEAVFRAARAAGVARAVHISTESVLSDGRPLVMVDETRPYPRRPAGSYSRSKIAAEKAVLPLNGHDLAVMVVRPRFVWGRDDTTALPALVEAARSGQMAWIEGGDYLTSTTHIDNLCHGIDLALRHGEGGEVYFLTDGEPVVFRTFITALLKSQNAPVTDKTAPRAVVRAAAALGDLVGLATRGRKPVSLTLQGFAASAVEVTLDIGKARSRLGYEPVVSIQAGLGMMGAQTARQQ
jgi:nucleoside-diphosphate-sugar epimerase